MRIVGGTLGGRRFHPPANIPARPTTDLAREGLFNILSNLLDFDGIHALDLFGGTGGITYEILSRGAAAVTVIEKDAGLAAFIRRTAEQFDVLERLKILRGDVLRFLGGSAAGEAYDLIFADPPYALSALKGLPDAVLGAGLLCEDGLLVIEHDERNDFEAHPHFMRAKAYGDTIFTFFTASAKTS